MGLLNRLIHLSYFPIKSILQAIKSTRRARQHTNGCPNTKKAQEMSLLTSQPKQQLQQTATFKGLPSTYQRGSSSAKCPVHYPPMKTQRTCMDFVSRKITRQLVTRGLGLPYGRIGCRQPLRHIRRSTMVSTARKGPKIKVCFTSKSIKVLTTAPHTYARVHRVYNFSIS